MIWKQKKPKQNSSLLKSQINPHFLFNTMNNIYGMVQLEDRRAPAMVSKLSRILRYLLYDCAGVRTYLLREKEVIQDFLEFYTLKKKDLADRVDFYHDGIKENDQIMPLLLINFVENCFKHSDIDTNALGWIKISLEVIDNHMHFQTSNTVKQKVQKSKKPGIGLANTKNMLRAEYPGRHSLKEELKAGIFSIDLKLELV